MSAVEQEQIRSMADRVESVQAASEGLSREDRLALVEELLGGSIAVTFSGKANAAQIARKVRPRVMRRIKKYSVGDEQAQAHNAVIEGDNLQAMATLYRNRGDVDMILTDPPYNTGNDWRYNDRWDEDPNDPGIGEWVGAADAGRHTKWMRFMYPRLRMMRSMLKQNGVLAICIDYRELFRLGQMLDEIFGEENRLGVINWQKATALKNSNGHVSNSTEYVLVYARDEELAKTQGLKREEAHNSRYSNPDNDPRGLWREGMLQAQDYSPRDSYGIQSPFTGTVHYPTGNTHWRHPRRDIKGWLEEWGASYEARDLGDGYPDALVLKDGFSDDTLDRANQVLERGSWPFIWFGRDGQGVPRKKIYLEAVKSGRIPQTYWSIDDLVSDELLPDDLGSVSWDYRQSGRSSDGASELKAMLGNDHGFETVKPLKLFEKLISIWCPPDGLVVDPFAGSGTTGHAVLQVNEKEETRRRFILVEQGRPEKGDSYARSLMSQRLRRAINGKWENGKGTPTGGGFSFFSLAKKVDADALLQMERDEMVDTVIASHFDENRRRGSNLIRLDSKKSVYLVAKNSDDEGFFLIWTGPDRDTNFTTAVYEQCADEAEAAGLKPLYHVYARLYLHQTSNVRFYRIPDRILSDFGLDLSSEPFSESDL